MLCSTPSDLCTSTPLSFDGLNLHALVTDKKSLKQIRPFLKTSFRIDLIKKIPVEMLHF